MSDSESTTDRFVIRPWIDPVVDDDGFDPRGRYVETFWLGVLGPTATWLARRLVGGLEREPAGFELDLTSTARAMGLSFSAGRSSPFSKALQRCVMFGLAHPIDRGLAVRRRFPAVSHRHVKRMPADLQIAHVEWTRTAVRVDELTLAHKLAMILLEAEPDPSLIEHRLVALGVDDAVAAEAAGNAARLEVDAHR